MRVVCLAPCRAGRWLGNIRRASTTVATPPPPRAVTAADVVRWNAAAEWVDVAIDRAEVAERHRSATLARLEGAVRDEASSVSALNELVLAATATAGAGASHKEALAALVVEVKRSQEMVDAVTAELRTLRESLSQSQAVMEATNRELAELKASLRAQVSARPTPPKDEPLTAREGGTSGHDIAESILRKASSVEVDGQRRWVLNSVRIGNLPVAGVSLDDVERQFALAGKVLAVTVASRHNGGGGSDESDSKTVRVVFESSVEAVTAVENFNGLVMAGRSVSVTPDLTPEEEGMLSLAVPE